MSATTWRVRRADMGDAPRLAVVGSASFLDTFADALSGDSIVAHCLNANSEAAYRLYLDSGGAAWIAETATGAPIGFALLTEPDLPGAAADDLELRRIYLLSRAHGSGIGTALMTAAEQEARNRGAQRLLLGVYSENGRAIAFYRKQGFVDIGTRQFQVGEGVYDDLVLARALN